MDTETQKMLATLEEKIDAVYVSAEKTRKYFLWTMWITIALFVLPLIGLAFVLPTFMASYVGQLQGLGV